MRHALKLLLLPAVVFATAGDFNSLEIHCEEAYAHLRDCCPDIGDHAICDQGCNSTVLSSAESDCILSLDCGPEIEAVCARVQGVPTHDRKPDQRVCP